MLQQKDFSVSLPGGVFIAGHKNIWRLDTHSSFTVPIASERDSVSACEVSVLRQVARFRGKGKFRKPRILAATVDSHSLSKRDSQLFPWVDFASLNPPRQMTSLLSLAKNGNLSHSPTFSSPLIWNVRLARMLKSLLFFFFFPLPPFFTCCSLSLPLLSPRCHCLGYWNQTEKVNRNPCRTFIMKGQHLAKASSDFPGF